MKKVCGFCMRSHAKQPALCGAKGQVVRKYLDSGLQVWQVMMGVENGSINLEGEARVIVAKKKRAG